LIEIKARSGQLTAASGASFEQDNAKLDTEETSHLAAPRSDEA
jgi:hypothetical protein